MDILGTAAYEGYVQTPIQTLNGIYVNQPKHFLPLAEEAKHLTEEIHKEKQAKQWAGIPHEKLLNQSFLDQLNSLQILEQLAPLQLAKEHLPSDIIDILERLGKADNIPFNQPYYIAENCVDRYYSKAIQTFVSIIKRQFIVLYYCCKKFRDMCTLFKYCFPFLPVSRMLRTSCRTDLLIEVTNLMKDNTVWVHFMATDYFPTNIHLSRPIPKESVRIETHCCIFK